MKTRCVANFRYGVVDACEYINHVSDLLRSKIMLSFTFKILKVWMKQIEVHIRLFRKFKLRTKT